MDTGTLVIHGPECSINWAVDDVPRFFIPNNDQVRIWEFRIRIQWIFARAHNNFNDRRIRVWILQLLEMINDLVTSALVITGFNSAACIAAVDVQSNATVVKSR